MVDGLFEGDACRAVVFHPATGLDAQAIATVQATVRRRLLRALVRRSLLPSEDAQAMTAWAHGGGFSVDAAVRIETEDRNGLERLLRYCARPAFALERLRQIDSEHLVYEGSEARPRRQHHRRAYAAGTARSAGGADPAAAPPSASLLRVLAPNAPLCAAVTALAVPAAPGQDTCVGAMPGRGTDAAATHRQAAR